MSVAVIVVSYNTADLLRQCLHSVQTSAHASGIYAADLQVVVVDNASCDGSAEMVASEFPWVTLIALDNNLGFTRANNLALAALGFPVQSKSGDTRLPVPDFLLLLNPDAFLVDGALGQMVGFLERSPSAGGCGAHLEYADGAFQHGAFQFPSPTQVALDLLPLYNIPGAGRLYDSRINGRYPTALWEGAAPFPVDFVLGAALMMRGETIQQIGGLDEGYFMYCEEMDWCMRADKAGWSIYSEPRARVIHHEAQSSKQTPWSSFRKLWQSRMRFYNKHRKRYPPGHLLLIRTIMRFGLRVRAALALRRFAHGEQSGVELQNELDAYTDVGRL